MYNLMTFYLVICPLGMKSLAEALVACKRIKVRFMILVTEEFLLETGLKLIIESNMQSNNKYIKSV